MLRFVSTSSSAALALCAVLSAPAAAATVCEDLWFARNAAFDEAGYCFRSPLGQAVFDNRDCTDNVPRVSESLVDHIARIRDREAELRCSVNTNRTELDVPMLARRLELMVQPLMSETESLCIGYIGPSVPLRTAPETDAVVIGNIEPGDSVLSAHEDMDGWAFASEVKRVGETETILGWHDASLETCEARAG
ncbi:DUF4453 domain-containing protein [Algicella marina]|nr:DUF4453 domain-containing protein [Algicella marina]